MDSEQPQEPQSAPNHDGGIDAGRIILSWETWEFPPVERSVRWYVAAAIIGLALLVYAVLTANFIFALIIIMFAVIMVMRDLKKPERVMAAITSEGIVFDQDFYPYAAIKDFSVIYEPPHVNTLYLGFNSRLTPSMSIALGDLNPNIVRQELLPFVFENLDRDGESLTDILTRVYKL